MLLRRASAFLLSAALLTACGSTTATPQAPPTTAPPATPTPTVVTTPGAALQDVTSALSDQGRGGPFTAVFGTLVLDGPANTVTLYVTDEAEGRRLVAAAAAAQPGIDTGLVRIVRCPYSRRQIDAVMDRIMDRSAAKALPFTVLEASMAHGSTGVKVGVEPAGVGSAELQQALDRLADGIPVTVHQARPGSDQPATHRPPTEATPSP